MKKIIIKLTIFFALLTLLDLSMGLFFSLYPYAKGEYIEKIHTIMTKETPELLIIGSSRAFHHYNPNMIEDSLQLSAYNAGIDGEGIVIGYGLTKGISQRSFPKYIICDIIPKFDLYDRGFHKVSLNYFYPYIKNDGIKNLIFKFNPDDRFKLISNSYRLNSSLFPLMKSIIKEYRYDKGFYPFYNTINVAYYKHEKSYIGIINPMKEKILRQFIEEALASNCMVVFAISPVFRGGDISEYSTEIDIIKEYNLPILNHLNDKRIIDNQNYFQDGDHLNVNGANEYSKIIISELDSLINDAAH